MVEPTRVPPHSDESERSLLGAVLLDGAELPNVLPLVRASDFYSTNNKKIYAACEQLYAAGTRVDHTLVLEELRRGDDLDKVGGEAYLAQLAAMVPSSAGAEEYARVIVDLSRRRQLIQAGRELQDAANNGVGRALEIIEGAREIADESSRTGWAGDAQTLENAKSRKVEWLWERRIARAMVTVLIGAEGAGKGQMCCDLIGAITGGRRMPDSVAADGTVYLTDVPHGTVLYLNAEDPLEITLIPRLEASGADMSKVIHCARHERTRGDLKERRTITLARDFHYLRELAIEHEVVAVIVDGIYRHAGVDTKSNEEMEPVMNCAEMLAEETNAAVILVHHPGKVPHARANSDASGGSIIVTVPRTVLMVGADKDGDRRALFVTKCNIAPQAPPLGYQVGPFRWTGQTDLTIDECRFHGTKSGGPKSPPVAEMGAEFLESALGNGARLTRKVEQEAEQAGISTRGFNGGKRLLDVRAGRNGNDGWLWLPGDEPEWARKTDT